MIFDRKQKELDTLDTYANDLPPAYDTLDASDRRNVASAGPSRRNAFQSSRFSFGGHPTTGFTAVSSGSGSGHSRSKSEALVPTAASQDDVRSTVRGLLQDVVQLTSPMRSNVEAAEGLLHSCASACEVQHISLARILQEQTIEGHSALYWAITMRPNVRPDDKVARREQDAFILAVATHAAPLAPNAICELRNACLAVSDNNLYQRIRNIPGLFPLPGKDRMLLHGTSSTTARATHAEVSSELDDKNSRFKGKQRELLGGFEDKAIVHENVTSAGDLFYVNLELQLFQRRMRVTNSLSVEFITRGRIWMLTFFVVPPPTAIPDYWYAPATYAKLPAPISSPQSVAVSKAAYEAALKSGIPVGSWAVSLAMLEASPRTYAEAALFVYEPDANFASTQSQRLDEYSAAYGVDTPPPLPSQSSSHANAGSSTRTSDQESRPSRMRFFNRASSNQQAAKEKEKEEEPAKSEPAITLILWNPITGPGPLISLPSSPPTDPEVPFTFPGELDLSEKSKRERKVLLKEERRWKKEKNSREAQTLTRDILMRAPLVAGLEASNASGSKASAASLMYDGCPFISPDGTLRATLGVEVYSKPKPKPKPAPIYRRQSDDSDDCTIC